MNILIADEFPIYRYLFKKYVQRCWPGASVSEAANVAAASLQLVAGSYDLIMLDILLPDSNNIEEMIELTAGRTPVVVFSDNGVSPARIPKLHKLGVDTFLKKSDPMEHMLKVFKTAMDR
ncbi:MAG: response regulator [Sphingobacteriales bacterium]|nr:MAG: response regulator [Sphingobacteriales bacterium]